MRIPPFVAAAVLALVLAIGIFIRITTQHASFQKEVRESLASSDGYDKRFIDLVHELELVLTTRASFPYLGVKDPMTGRRREVSSAILAAAPVPRRNADKAGKIGSARPVKALPPEPTGKPVDQVRLTAIIADDYGQHTAIVMDGERSMSVDVGDLIGTRKVLRITSREISMEDDTTVYTYSLAGARLQMRK